MFVYNTVVLGYLSREGEFRQRLGMFLKKYAERRFGNPAMFIHRDGDDRTGVARWRIVQD
jgi:hypothetical protein